MGVRHWVDQNAVLVTVGAVGLLVVALGTMFMQLRGAPRPEAQVYFWDLARDEAFVHTANAIPPIEAPSGGEAVRAYLFTCGACEPDEWVGYLERYTDEGKRLYEQTGEFPEHDPIVVRDLRGGEWVPFDSDAADRLMGSVYERCDAPIECLP